MVSHEIYRPHYQRDSADLTSRLIENLRNPAVNGGISRGITRDIQALLTAGFRRFLKTWLVA